MRLNFEDTNVIEKDKSTGCFLCVCVCRFGDGGGVLLNKQSCKTIHVVNYSTEISPITI